MATVERGDDVPWLLRAIAVTACAVPAYMVFAPLGAVGYITMILALILAAFWLASTVWGLHDALSARHPSRVALGMLWMVTVGSYIWMASGPATTVERASADRWLLTLLAITAVAMVTTERVVSATAAMSLVRALVLGATLCSIVAIYQFLTGVDPWTHLQSLLVGMVNNGGATTFQVRGELTRVAGTTFTPIELGVVSAMVLPFAVWRASFDGRGRQWWHWVQCALLVFASVCTISRSAMLALFVIAIVVIPFLPSLARQWAVVCVPVAVMLLFLGVPGLIATFGGIVAADTSDPSLATRLNNYPLVQSALVERPWFGTGPATYLPSDALRLLDNQYLHSGVEMGVPGIVAVVAFFVVPGSAALIAARHFADPQLRLLSGAVAGAGFVAAVASATFDSLSFPTFTLVYPFVVGLSGAVWILAKNTPRTVSEASADGTEQSRMYPSGK